MNHVIFRTAIPLVFAIGLLLAVAGGSANAQECETVSPLNCVVSKSCILAVDEDIQAGYLCRPAANFCEIGFQQHIPDPNDPFQITPQDKLAETCEAKQGCGYVTVGACYCPPIEGLECLCSGGTPPTCQPLE